MSLRCFTGTQTMPSKSIYQHAITWRSYRGLIGAGLLIAAVAGCSGDKRVPVYPVSGHVSFKGKPPIGAQVVLLPVKTNDADCVSPSGTVKDDGSFAITSYDSDDGAPQGDYVATIRWYKLSPQGNPGPNVLPAQYASAKGSPIKVTVGNGPVDIPSISIK